VKRKFCVRQRRVTDGKNFIAQIMFLAIKSPKTWKSAIKKISFFSSRNQYFPHIPYVASKKGFSFKMSLHLYNVSTGPKGTFLGSHPSSMDVYWKNQCSIEIPSNNWRFNADGGVRTSAEDGMVKVRHSNHYKELHNLKFWD
jgi:hypothetical protein